MLFLWREAVRRFGSLSLHVLILNLLIVDCAVSQEDISRRFILNEDMIRGVRTADDPHACSPKEVIRDLFKRIGPVANIYPTENYFYFKFHRGGKAYSGSLRLAVDSRDNGIVQFVCYESYKSWLETEDVEIQIELSNADGVIVTKINRFEYSIEFEGTAVKFVLNKIDQTPDKEKLGKDEHFAGRIFDESGLVFELIYNKAAKAFYFALDTKSRVFETFVKMKDKVYVGRRTGFVFFEDVKPKRFILIAVHAEEIHKNSWYDGPFDQLPENFYEEIKFFEYAYDAYPELVGKLTAGGSYINQKLIFGISPYRQYVSRKDLRFVDSCVKKYKQTTVILCLTHEAP